MLRKFLTGLAVLIAVLAVAAWSTAPRPIQHVPQIEGPGVPVDEWLARNEATVNTATPIVPGAEKRVLWADGQAGRKTRYSVVYLHGFSATRQEIAPVSELVSAELGANLFETRLRGHGLLEDPLSGITAEEWLDDGVEALQVGAALGERIVVIGTSTGATLAIVLADHEAFAAVSHLILVSPNYGPRDASAEILTWPGGPQLAQLLVGETRSWTAANDAQERFWSTSYPTVAVVEMMRLVELARSKFPLRTDVSIFTAYSPNDTVVDTDRILEAHRQTAAPRNELVVIDRSGDPSDHVLAGDILAAENNAAVVQHIVGFVEASPL